MRVARLAALMAVASLPFVASPASAAPCVPAAVSVYTAAGFSCNVDGVTFSNINVSISLSGAATGSLDGFSIFNQGGEFGLNLLYHAFAANAGDAVDIHWTMNVSGNLLTDALLALSGQTSGSGLIGVNETLSPNGVSLTLNGAGTTVQQFAPIASLTVLKDDFTFVPNCPQVGPCREGFATSSILTNAFSLTQVPIPGAMGLFATGLGMMGILGWRKKRKTKAFA